MADPYQRNIAAGWTSLVDQVYTGFTTTRSLAEAEEAASASASASASVSASASASPSAFAQSCLLYSPVTVSHMNYLDKIKIDFNGALSFTPRLTSFRLPFHLDLNKYKYLDIYATESVISYKSIAVTFINKGIDPLTIHKGDAIVRLYVP